jgi:hypothetical protein
MDAFVTLSSSLIIASMAIERIIEIIKGSLKGKFEAPQWLYPALAALLGSAAVSFVADPIPEINLNQYVEMAIFGFAVASGSGFWNRVLDVLRAIRGVQVTQTP